MDRRRTGESEAERPYKAFSVDIRVGSAVRWAEKQDKNGVA
jgi:hypothetical protein